jgi:DNA-directed RNA polymerase subunit RPC12/RpoP
MSEKRKNRRIEVGADTVCPCGSKVSTRLRKPNHFENRFSKAQCKSCGSRFLFSVSIDKENPRGCKVHIDILNLAPGAMSAMEARALEKTQNG